MEDMTMLWNAVLTLAVGAFLWWIRGTNNDINKLREDLKEHALSDAKTREFIEYMANQRVIEPKFLQEFAEGGAFTPGKVKLTEKFYLSLPLQKSSEKIYDYLQSQGLVFIEINTYENEINENNLDITFKVDKINELYVSEIEIEGNSRTKDRVIRREIE